MRGRRITALVVAVVLGTGALAACSDDDGDGGDDGSGAVLENAESPDADGDFGGTDATGTTLPPGAFAGGCADFGEAFTALASSFSGEIDTAALDGIDETIAAAPERVRDDLQTYVDVFRDYVAALEDAGVDLGNPGDIPPEHAAEVGELVDVFSSDEFLEASATIQEFIASNCAG